MAANITTEAEPTELANQSAVPIQEESIPPTTPQPKEALAITSEEEGQDSSAPNETASGVGSANSGSRRNLLSKYRTYVTRYRSKLEELGAKDLLELDVNEASDEQLTEACEEIRMMLVNNGTVDGTKQMAVMALHAVENIACNFTPLKIQGYTNALTANESFMMALELELIDCTHAIRMTPRQQIVLTMASTALTLHITNSSASPSPPISIEQAQAVEKKYGDL